MPLIALNEDQRAAGIASMHPELVSLLTDKEVEAEMRALLGHLGFRRTTTFANYASTEETFRQQITGDLGITPEDPLLVRLQISNLIEAWRTARGRNQALDTAAAEARAAGRARDVPQDEAIGMREAHERAYEELEDHEFPSRDYVGWRLAQFEQGRFYAERSS